MKKRTIRNITFRKIIYLMTIILLSLTLLSVNFMHSQQKRDIIEQITQKSNEAIFSWVPDRDKSIRNLASYLFSRFAGNEDLALLPTETDPVKRYQRKENLLDTLKTTMQLNGIAQSVFLCVPQENDYLYLTRYTDERYTVSESQRIRDDIISLIRTEYSGEASAQWSACTINDTPCMLWMYRLGENICGAWIDCNSYLQDCRRLSAIADSITLQMVKDGSVVQEITHSSSVSIKPSSVTEIYSQELRASIVVTTYIDGVLNENHLRFDYVLFSATLLITILIIVFAFQATMYIPIRRLTWDVAALQKNDDMLPIHENYRIKEVYDLSHYINQSMQKLKEMKIDTYEARLSEQQMAQEFLLMRHKTHFFINCMSVIHALAGVHDDALIQKLSLSLIGYLRKIDFEKQELIRLNDELSLIHSYIDIQKVRFGDSFRFIEEVPIDLFEAGIPPLILQTFVENAVEHGRIHEKDNLIRLDISFMDHFMDQEGAYLRIDITDNGDGFSEDLLEEFKNIPEQRPKRLSQGHGVGIGNAIARIKHIYGAAAVITIENMIDGGAHVHMVLPIIDQEEQ